MRQNLRFGPVISAYLCLAVSVAVGANAWGASAAVTAQQVTVNIRLPAYAAVTPISVATLRAAQTGVIEDLSVVPGQRVSAGEILARLRGPEISAQLARRRSNVASAHAALRAAKRTFAIEHQKFSAHLTTRQSIVEAQLRVLQAQARLSAASMALNAVIQSTELRAREGGIVSRLSVSSGDRVQAGQALLILDPDRQLWLKATYYGKDADLVRPGMHGSFKPANGAAPIPVAVVSVGPVLHSDGGLPVGLRPTKSDIPWRAGETGLVTLRGPTRIAVAVPTRALILDDGKWWVLEQVPGGYRRQIVIPGPSRGNDTLIERGLSPGSRIVVGNAYLKFHRDFSQHYQQPD